MSSRRRRREWKRGRSKKYAERVHAKKRAFLRYHMEVDAQTRKRIVEAIWNQTARFIRRHSGRVTEWEVRMDGQTLRLLYDKSRQEIITFLPPPAPMDEETLEEDRQAANFWMTEAALYGRPKVPTP